MAIKKQIRIGILIKEFDALKNWELRIIDGILNDPSLNLVLLVNDGRKTEGRKNNFFTKLKKILNSKNTIGRILLTIQKKIESLICSLKQPLFSSVIEMEKAHFFIN